MFILSLPYNMFLYFISLFKDGHNYAKLVTKTFCHYHLKSHLPILKILRKRPAVCNTTVLPLQVLTLQKEISINSYHLSFSFICLSLSFITSSFSSSRLSRCLCNSAFAACNLEFSTCTASICSTSCDRIYKDHLLNN